MQAWIDAAPDDAERASRADRATVVFGLGGVGWDGVRVLERYELAYELGLLDESPTGLEPPGRTTVGVPMQLDHRRIVATALGRLRGKLTYRPVVFELLPPTFTLLQLQRLVEALSGVRLHKQNFRRLAEGGGLVEGTGQLRRSGGRPAELFRFRREVLPRASPARRRHPLDPQLTEPGGGWGPGAQPPGGTQPAWWRPGDTWWPRSDDGVACG